MATRDEEARDEGTEPQEEVGPDGCEPSPAECGFVPMTLDGPPEDSEFSPQAELHEQMMQDRIDLMNDPIDGLARPVDSPLQFAPPFTYERVICVEDARVWVEIFLDELSTIAQWVRVACEEDEQADARQRRYLYDSVNDSFALQHWSRANYSGTEAPGDSSTLVYARTRYKGDGSERERETYDPKEVVRLWGQPCVKIAQGAFRPVRPVRPVCKHYKRQCFNNDDVPDPMAPGGRPIFRHCTMRRSIGGAFMSLRDQNVFACDHRDPPDPQTVKFHMDDYDHRLLTERANETLIPLFGLGGEDVRTEGESK